MNAPIVPPCAKRLVDDERVAKIEVLVLLVVVLLSPVKFWRVVDAVKRF